MDWTTGPYNGKAVFSGLYLISFLPPDFQFAFPAGQRVDVPMVVPVLAQILWASQGWFSFHATLHNHLLWISPSPVLTNLYKILLQFCIYNTREFMCIKIKFAGFVLDVICHLTSECNGHKQGVQWCLQENRHRKSNQTLLLPDQAVKSETQHQIQFCWWQESIKPAAAFWCHPPSFPVPFDQGIVAWGCNL